jgi:hypothetical protein
MGRDTHPHSFQDILIAQIFHMPPSAIMNATNGTGCEHHLEKLVKSASDAQEVIAQADLQEPTP